MTAATPGPSGQNIFSMFSGEANGLYRTKRETFVFSVVGQALILGLIIYLTRVVLVGTPPLVTKLPPLDRLPVVFSGDDGGGGGNHDLLPDSQGDPPRASLADQIVPPTVIVPKQMPRLPAEETVVVTPEIKFPQGGPIGDPLSQFKTPSDGPGGPTGIGPGCCGGIGPSAGPGVGPGPSGIFPAGIRGVTVPEVIFNPEPGFSDEARKVKQQGIVLLLVVVGKDGHTYNIHVRQSLGMGLDEKAIEAVSRWRFRPATFNGQPVATQIAVQVDFHLY
jgi:periplasmic protein TonB